MAFDNENWCNMKRSTILDGYTWIKDNIDSTMRSIAMMNEEYDVNDDMIHDEMP